MALTKISTDGVKDDAVTAGKIPANAVGSSELADNAVDTAAIANDAVTLAKMADDSVSASQIINNAVTVNALATDAVTTPKIGDQQVTLAKLEHGTSSNDGKFLRANNGADPTFETVSIPAGTTINNNSNNRIITGSNTANTLEGEANLAFDGKLVVGGSVPSSSFGFSNGSLDIQGDGSNAYLDLGNPISGHSNGTLPTFRIKTDDSNKSAVIQKLYGGDNIAYKHIEFSGRHTSFHDPISGEASVARFTQDGLCFGSDTAAANALDDYEEGTFTPTNATIGLQSNYTYGFYQKVGDWVSVQLGVRFNNNGSAIAIYIDGLPFTPTADQYGQYANSFAIGYATGNHIQFAMASGSGRIYLYTKNAGTQQSTHFDDDYVRLFGTYKVA